MPKRSPAERRVPAFDILRRSLDRLACCVGFIMVDRRCSSCAQTSWDDRPCTVAGWSRLCVMSILALGECAMPSQWAETQTPVQTETRSTAPASTIDFSRASPIDEDYRQQFTDCDEHNVFRGEVMQGFRRCSGDKNNLTRLVRFPPIPGLPGDVIAFTSKLGVDYDGSFVAANTPGMTDQKDTSLELAGPNGKPVPTDSDTVSYVVMPNAGNADPGIRKEFAARTRTSLGNVGIVVFQDHVIPVVVADGGPYNKIGEGSMALHRALGTELCLVRNSDGVCTKVNENPSSISGGVTTIIFTGSSVADATAATVASKTTHEALRLLAIFSNAQGTMP